MNGSRRRSATTPSRSALDAVFDGGDEAAAALAGDGGDGDGGLASPLPPALAALPLAALCTTLGARALLAALSKERLVDLVLELSHALAAAGGGGAPPPAAKRPRGAD